MRIVYAATLLIGVLVVCGVQSGPLYALPRDVSVAAILSKRSDEWTIHADEDLSLRLAGHNKGVLEYQQSSGYLKNRVTEALAERAQYMNDIRLQGTWHGIALIIIAVIGLHAEHKVRRTRDLQYRNLPLENKQPTRPSTVFGTSAPKQ